MVPAQGSQVIREIDFVIRIKDKDMGFKELREILVSELTRFEDIRRKPVLTGNPIQDFLKVNIEKSIILRDNTRVFFSRYRETEGSFVIEFSVILITLSVHYGSLRQGLDILIKDTIADYFEELLERHIPVSITVQSTDNAVFDIPSQAEIQVPVTPTHRSFAWPLSISIVSLLISIAFIVFILFIHPANKKPNSNSDLNEKYLELLIEKKVNERLSPEKFKIEILYPTDSTHPETKK